MDGLEAQMRQALRDYTDSVIVPIIAEFSDNDIRKKFGSHATGTLFEFESRHFILTAAHAIRYHDKFSGKVGIPVAMENAEILTFGPSLFVLPRKHSVQDIVDIGIIELTDQHVEKIRRKYRFLSYENIEVKLKNPSILITGFPRSLSDYDEQTEVVEFRPLRLMTRLLKEEARLRIEERNEFCFFVEWASSFDEDNSGFRNVPPFQELEGLSGSPIWQYFHEDKLWSPEKNLKIAGVQCSVKEKDWIKGTKIGYLSTLFQKVDDRIYRKLREIGC